MISPAFRLFVLAWSPIFLFFFLYGTSPAWFCSAFSCVSITVNGNSMSPTIMHGETRMLLYQYYNYFPVSRGDIVGIVFDPIVGKNVQWIKRVVAVEGDSLAVDTVDGTWILNGTRMDGIRDDRNVVYNQLRYHGFRIPKGYVLVLGDRSENSLDSRMRGLIPLKNIVGRVT